jgi:integrase
MCPTILLSGGREHRGGIAYRRALLATLVFGGLRIGELTALEWRDVDFASHRVQIRASKTDAGVRTVDLLPILHFELAAHRARATDDGRNMYVFASASGTRLEQNNIRRRVLERSVELANQRLSATGRPPLPDGLTPHRLRHTFASVLVAIGIDPGSVMDQIGHTDPGFTLRVYRHGMHRGAKGRQDLSELVAGEARVQPAESSPAPRVTGWSARFPSLIRLGKRVPRP